MSADDIKKRCAVFLARVEAAVNTAGNVLDK